jgi:hypothetical protein
MLFHASMLSARMLACLDTWLLGHFITLALASLSFCCKTLFARRRLV